MLIILAISMVLELFSDMSPGRQTLGLNQRLQFVEVPVALCYFQKDRLEVLVEFVKLLVLQ